MYLEIDDIFLLEVFFDNIHMRFLSKFYLQNFNICYYFCKKI